MTLREKFKQWLDTKPRCQIRDVQLEVIADDYAIGFAEWVEKLSGSHIDSLDYYLYLDNTIKELLEIYKKEKGL
jgi:hypothetical protein